MSSHVKLWSNTNQSTGNQPMVYIEKVFYGGWIVQDELGNWWRRLRANETVKSGDGQEFPFKLKNEYTGKRDIQLVSSAVGTTFSENNTEENSCLFFRRCDPLSAAIRLAARRRRT
jgi:hypothetical protein